MKKCEHAITERIVYGDFIYYRCADCKETQRKESLAVTP